MPLETQNGKAHIWGIRNNGSPIEIEGYASFTLDSMRVNHKFNLDNISDELGFDRALIATNGYLEEDVTFMPSGTTRTMAEQAAVILEPLSKVTISNMSVITLNGDWIYVGDASIELSTKTGKMTIKLRKYLDTDQNAALVQTVAE